MVYARSKIFPVEWDAQTLLAFWDTNGSPNLGYTTRPSNNKQKKKKQKKKQKKEKRELTKLWT